MDKLERAMKPVTWLVGLNGIRTQEHAIALHDALQQSRRHLVDVEFRNRMGSESMGKHWKSETKTEERKPIWLSCIALCRHEVVWSNVRWMVSNFGRSDFMFFNLWQDLLALGFALRVIEFNFTIPWISLLITSCRTIFNFSFQFIDPEIGITWLLYYHMRPLK